MALTIEDGTIVAGADSFVTVAEFDEWLTANGYVIAGNKEILLRRSYSFMSVLQWCDPHDSAFTVRGAFKTAQMEIAHAIEGGLNPAAVSDARALKRKKIDVLEKEWFGAGNNSAQSTLSRIPMAAALLSDYLCGASSHNFELVR